jgi:histidinol phosphatase-like PHP family hydrolase
MFNKIKLFKNIKLQLKKNIIPRVDLHNHTNWTDGEDTVLEMYNHSIKKNINTFLFSEHSRKESGEWFNKFYSQIKKLPKSDCNPLVGTEVKVLDFKGNIDISKNIKKKCDLIMVSVHRFPGEKGNIKKNKLKLKNNEIIDIEYELSRSAIINSDFDILGHPFGMSLKRFKIKPPIKLFENLMDYCKKYNKAFEINFNYHKNPKKILSACLKKNTLISLGSNSHKKSEIGNVLNEKYWSQ